MTNSKTTPKPSFPENPVELKNDLKAKNSGNQNQNQSSSQNPSPVTNGNSNGTVTNGHCNGNSNGNHTQTDTTQTNGTDNSKIPSSTQTNDMTIKNSKIPEITPTQTPLDTNTTTNSIKNCLDEKIENQDKDLNIQLQISKKRAHVEKLTIKLAAEEARYTVLKKIRLSQLSVENSKAEMQKKKEMAEQQRRQKLNMQRNLNRQNSNMTNDEMDDDNSASDTNGRGSRGVNRATEEEYRPPGAAKPSGGQKRSFDDSGKSTPNNIRSSTPSSAFDKTFKPIQPDLNGKNNGATKVLTPTPLSTMDPNDVEIRNNTN